MGTMIIWIVIGTSCWVLFDATTIGVKRGQIKGLANMGPLGWFLACLVMWIIAFPLYLAKRNEFRRINQGLKIDESKEIANKNKVTFSSDGTQVSEEYTIPAAKLTKIKSSDVLSGYKATGAAKRKECTMEMSSDQYCSGCGASLSPEAKFCPACGKQASTSAPSAQLSESEPTSESPLRKELFKSWIGGLMIIGGLIAAVYFFFFFDTSVEVPTQQIFGQTVGGGRVNNLGLMAQRQNGIIFSFGAAIVGAVIEFFARSRK